MRERRPGKSQPVPKASAEAPERMMVGISSEPCRFTTKSASVTAPCCMRKVSKQPNITPL